MRAVFVLIKCDLGKAYQVADQAMETIEEISEIYSTSGQYDLLAKFYLEDGTDIGRFVTEQVQTLPGIKDTFTLITFNAFTNDKNPAGTRLGA
ncbi:Lrp/AsnC ligand binding domain-containing protein [Novispirillum sp. DQ9]|uniref:Lrp/AsnC ligand binding domain-containing protein n=1 Tax=Novispirillum sp. DQ9 TaxID=3398612 RepID=UPI003C7B3879